MRLNLTYKIWSSLVIVLVGTIALVAFIGNPGELPTEALTQADVERAEDLGKEIAVLMGQVSVAPEKCSEVLSRVPNLLENIAPLSDKLVALNSDLADSPEARSVIDLSVGIVWLQDYCPNA